MMVNARGQAVIEALVISLLLVVTLGMGLKVVSLGVARLWLERSVYQGVTCVLKDRMDCREEVLRNISALKWGAVTSLNLQMQKNIVGQKTATGELKWCNSKQKNCEDDAELSVSLKKSELDLLTALPSLGF